jgi:hypothetical protein
MNFQDFINLPEAEMFKEVEDYHLALTGLMDPIEAFDWEHILVCCHAIAYGITKYRNIAAYYSIDAEAIEGNQEYAQEIKSYIEQQVNAKSLIKKLTATGAIEGYELDFPLPVLREFYSWLEDTLYLKEDHERDSQGASTVDSVEDYLDQAGGEE